MASIRKFKTKWQAQVRRTGYPTQTRSFERKQDAIAWARRLEASIDQGRAGIPARSQTDVTLGDLLERYRTTITPAKKGSFQEDHRLVRMGRAPIARHRLTHLTSSVAADHRDQRLKLVVPGTVARELSILRHVIEIARSEWGIVMNSNPFADIAMPKPSAARTRRLRNGEEASLMRACAKARNPLMAPLVRLAIETGMRRSEILRIRAEHVNLLGRTLFIPESKNGEARTVPLNRQALLALHGRISSANERLFPLSGNAVRLAWERTNRRAGIDDLRFHDLRHEAISRFFELGLNLPEVALISGHRSPAMLMLYTHVVAEKVASKI